MHGERVPSWLPISLAAGAVAIAAVTIMRPALSEAEALDRAADELEAVAATDATARGAAERMRAALAATAAAPIADERRAALDFRVMRTTGDLAAILPILAALDAAPRACVRALQLESDGSGEITLVAEVDSSLEPAFARSEESAP